MSTLVADYVVVGGGLAGCAIASRLKQQVPSISILVLEAGRNPESKHDIITPMGGFALAGSGLDWQYHTEPVKETQDRTHTLTAGKTLGGGTILNYGGWSRGDAADYDAWSRLTGYDDWNYENLLPLFKRSERFTAGTKFPEASQLGFDGPMKIIGVNASNPNPRYPLSEPLRQSWSQLGLEIWIDGQRQPTQHAYPLGGIQVLTDSPVAKVLLTENSGAGLRGPKLQATGVLLHNGQKILAKSEVLLCAGAISSPAILMASGIGPASLLGERKLSTLHDLPRVGENMTDHFALFQLFKLRSSKTQRGLALGHPDLADPAFSLGLPADCVVNEGLPRDMLEKALDEDGIIGTERQALLEPGRCFLEYLVIYHPTSAPVPADGTYVSTPVMLTLPSSRGCISPPHNNVGHPTIEPGYFATALDRAALIHGVRRMLQLMLATKALETYVDAEVPPPGLSPLHVGSSDAGIEVRIRAAGAAHCHTVGTCALGSVVDAQLRVHGTGGLRVCDGSIFPSPVGGHPQATLYGVAEKAAECIALQRTR